MSELPSIADRVAAGAVWLDEHFADWPRLITVERLDISSPCRCVLGQLHDDYPYTGELPGEESADLSTASASRIGRGFEIDFALQPGESRDDQRDRVAGEYGRLTDEWARVIEARRAEVTTDA